MIIRPVILSGGVGSRLWPLSTPQRPKQFLELTAPISMISLTAERLNTPHKGDLEFGTTLVVGASKHEHLIRNELPDAELILEPCGRNSAPAVAAACLACQPDDILLILSADHHIAQPEAFLDAIELAQREADKGAIVTFGIQPTHPATGYGYIQHSQSAQPIHDVLKFVEKPKLPTAEEYFKSGAHLWNAGIFLFKASTMRAAFEAHAPDILAKVERALGPKNTQVRHLDEAVFSTVEGISIDYAIMEHAGAIKTVPVDMGWSDVGDFDALWELGTKDADGNVTAGQVVLTEASDLFVYSDGPKVAVADLKNYIVVAKDDTVMIAPRGSNSTIATLGKTAQEPMPTETGTAAKALLWSAFSAWSKVGWDDRNGGFFEQLHLNGEPDLTAARRVRVQARQVFSFARAMQLGWDDTGEAARLVDNGLKYLDETCRHPQGGWLHTISADGQAIESTQDLYDHAFIMLAGATAFHATGREQGLTLARDALSFIDEYLLDGQNGGYFETPSNREHRRSNPHMHLLEAFLALYQATKDADYLRRATEIVVLFETRFFSAQEDILREHFTADWRPQAGKRGRSFEPGHHYGWASLLAMHDALTGRETLSWRRRLIRTADMLGIDPVSGMARNLLGAGGVPEDRNHRLWHQLERFRAKCLHPEGTHSRDIGTLFAAISSAYFDTAPTGLWHDETDANGSPVVKPIPASMLYHLATTLVPNI